MTFKPLILVPFLATPALAGSLDQAQPEPAPVMPVAPVAPQMGGDWSGPSVGAQLGYGFADADGPVDDTGDAALYGVRAYYDHDFGNWVAGGGLQYDGTDIDIGNAGSIDGLAKVGGRVGYDMGSTLVYGSGGYAHVTTSEGSFDAGSSDGYYVGAGIETYVSQNVTVSGEVNYNEFNDFDTDSLKVGATTATVGVNYRF